MLLKVCSGIILGRIQGFLEGGSDTLSRARILEATPIFDRLRETASLIDLFLIDYLLKHTKVSHSIIFFSSVAREGGSIQPIISTSVGKFCS